MTSVRVGRLMPSTNFTQSPIFVHSFSLVFRTGVWSLIVFLAGPLFNELDSTHVNSALDLHHAFGLLKKRANYLEGIPSQNQLSLHLTHRETFLLIHRYLRLPPHTGYPS